MTEAQYHDFIDALLEAEYGEFKDWELGTCGALDDDTPYFDGCMPVEEMARRGRETLRFGPMKPVGLTNPRDPDNKPYAIVQLRQDNKLGTLWNMVGFQTKMKWGEQTRVFKTIPGLEDAVFARLGGLHRNTFINAPKLLDSTLALSSRRRPGSKDSEHQDSGLRRNDSQVIRFAGQITGCEGYIESAAVGLMAARFALADLCGETQSLPPTTTAHGALLSHITGGADAKTYQPMNVNFGLFPPLPDDMAFQITKNGKKRRLKGMDKKRAVTSRALSDLEGWIGLQKKAA
jgi:methylenetetrahydrofolate--tRNA-(uracil-5-)-methyltransferase